MVKHNNDVNTFGLFIQSVTIRKFCYPLDLTTAMADSGEKKATLTNNNCRVSINLSVMSRNDLQEN